MIEGILLVNKKIKKTSFSIIYDLRKITKVKKIGHAGTLDPMAEGLMIILIGKNFTKKAYKFMSLDKRYYAKLHLGKISKTFDKEGEIKIFSKKTPKKEEIIKVLNTYFQNEIEQIPPMFSAKKINGQKLYKLARKNIEVKRNPVKVKIKINILHYKYPNLELDIKCSKGTYIRTLADDIGKKLSCGAYLEKLIRTKIGPFHIKDAVNQDFLKKGFINQNYLIKDITKK